MASSSAVTRVGTPRIFALSSSAARVQLEVDAAREGYQQALEGFSSVLRKYDGNLHRDFERALHRGGWLDASDIHAAIQEVAHSIAKKQPVNSYQWARRCGQCLERVKDFASVGDVFVGGAQNMAVSGAWGALRIAIDVSLTLMFFYDKLSEMLSRIGRFTHANDSYHVLFPADPRLKALAFQYLSGLIAICTEVIRYAHKSAPSQLMSALGSTFDTRFGPLEKDLQSIASAISEAANTQAISLSQEGHRDTQSKLGQVMGRLKGMDVATAKGSRDLWKHKVTKTISKGDIKHTLDLRYYCEKGTSTWMLQTDEYRQWQEASASRTLWVTGKLGSGKSVILASLVMDLFRVAKAGSTEDSAIAHYFWRKGVKTAVTANSILGNIAYQVLHSKAVEPALDAHLEKFGGFETLKLSNDSCIDLLLAVVPPRCKLFIVLDGLGNCAPSEVHTIFRELERLAAARKVLLLCSSHPHWKELRTASNTLPSPFVTVLIEDTDRTAEAKEYIAGELAMWESKGLYLGNAKDLIQEKLLAGWQNMFLWLSLQLRLLREDLEHSPLELTSALARIHEELSELYTRALMHLAETEGAKARTVLELVTAAEPPLTFKELRTAANVIPSDTKWRPLHSSKIPADFCWQFGRYLLETDPEDRQVRLVHPTVALHLCGLPNNELASAMHFPFEQAEERVAMVCLTYLNMPALADLTSLRRKPADRPQRGVFHATAQPVVQSSGLGRRLMSMYGSKIKEDASSTHTLNVPVVVSNVLGYSSALFDLGDLRSYAKANYLALTRDMALDDKCSALWWAIFEENDPLRVLASSARDRGDDLGWAIDQGHRPLVTCHFNDSNRRSLELDTPRTMRLYSLLHFRWKGFEFSGPFWEMYVPPRPLETVTDRGTTRITDNVRRLRDAAEGLLFILLNTKSITREARSEICLDIAQRVDIDDLMLAGRPPLVYALQDEADDGDDDDPELRSLLMRDTVSALLAAGANPNGNRTVHGDTRALQFPILYYSLRADKVECLELLLRYGADPNTQDSLQGMLTCLMQAILIHGSVPGLRLLLQYGADACVRDSEGKTLLHYQINAEEGLRPMLAELAKAGQLQAALNAANEQGVTVLYDALLHVSDDSPVHALIDAGARRLAVGEDIIVDIVQNDGTSSSSGPLRPLREGCARAHRLGPAGLISRLQEMEDIWLVMVRSRTLPPLKYLDGRDDL